jgi:hypothetical protein
MLAFLGRQFQEQGDREAKNTVEEQNGLAKGTEHNASRSCLLHITSHLDPRQRKHYLSLNLWPPPRTLLLCRNRHWMFSHYFTSSEVRNVTGTSPTDFTFNWRIFELYELKELRYSYMFRLYKYMCTHTCLARMSHLQEYWYTRIMFFSDRMTVHHNRFLLNKTNRYTEFHFYWYYDSTCFGQPFCPSSGVLSRTSALVHSMQLRWPFATRSRMELDVIWHPVPSCST